MARSPSQMAETLGGLGRLTELRQRLLFVFGALIIYRIGTFIPVPGVNPQALLQFMNSQQGTIVDVFNLFTGGALERFSLFALGVMPYISASIIMQLMSSAIPQLQQLKKEGSSGRQKITQYTRNFTVILAAIQAGGVAFALQGQTSVVLAPGFGFLFTAIVSLTAGTIFLMGLGEQITERGVGNGISLIIFAGIVASLPRAVAGTLELVNTGQLSIPATLIILVLVLAVMYFIVRVERGQRRITVNYAQRPTAEYIDHVLTRLTMVGSIYLVAVCLLPDVFRVLWQVPFYFGGTSVLIVVVVIMDFIAQIQAHLISHQYDSLMKKANLKSYGRSGVVRR